MRPNQRTSNLSFTLYYVLSDTGKEETFFFTPAEFQRYRKKHRKKIVMIKRVVRIELSVQKFDL